MANFATIAREQENQRAILELILRNQFATMNWISRKAERDKVTCPEIRVMLAATTKWLETEPVTTVEV